MECELPEYLRRKSGAGSSVLSRPSDAGAPVKSNSFVLNRFLVFGAVRCERHWIVAGIYVSPIVYFGSKFKDHF